MIRINCEGIIHGQSQTDTRGDLTVTFFKGGHRKEEEKPLVAPDPFEAVTLHES